MAHRKLPATALRRRGHRKQRGHALQFLLLIAAGVLLIATAVALNGYAQGNGWTAWSPAENVAAPAPLDEDLLKQLAASSIRFHSHGPSDFGHYTVERYDRGSESLLTVDFLLQGTTPCQDEASFNRFMAENRDLVREGVALTIRDCHLADLLNEANLARKLTARLNRVLGGRMIGSVTLQKFAVYETFAACPPTPIVLDTTPRVGQPSSRP